MPPPPTGSRKKDRKSFVDSSRSRRRKTIKNYIPNSVRRFLRPAVDTALEYIPRSYHTYLPEEVVRTDSARHQREYQSRFDEAVGKLKKPSDRIIIEGEGGNLVQINAYQVAVMLLDRYKKDKDAISKYLRDNVNVASLRAHIQHLIEGMREVMRDRKAILAGILKIHADKSLATLNRKILQQHQHNCWSDAFFVILFHSDALNRLIRPHIEDLLNYFLDTFRGDYTKVKYLYRRAHIYSIAEKLFGQRLSMHHKLFLKAQDTKEPPVLLVTLNFVRYFIKLIQIYENQLLSKDVPTSLVVASPLRNAFNTTQDELKPFCLVTFEESGQKIPLPKEGGYANIFFNMFTQLSSVRFSDMKNGSGVGEIYAYYLTIKSFSITTLHAVSIFKSGGVWYLYDNEMKGKLIPITDKSNWTLTDFAYMDGHCVIEMKLDTGEEVTFEEKTYTEIDYFMEKDYSYVFVVPPS